MKDIAVRLLQNALTVTSAEPRENGAAVWKNVDIKIYQMVQ